MGILLIILAIVSPSPIQARPTPKVAVPGYSRTRQSCSVDAPSTYLEQAREFWCGDDQVANISLRTDTRNYIAQVQLSPVGESAWRASRAEAVDRFRQVVNDVAQAVRMNVAVTVRSAAGKELARCSRDLIARTATCAVP